LLIVRSWIILLIILSIARLLIILLIALLLIVPLVAGLGIVLPGLVAGRRIVLTIILCQKGRARGYTHQGGQTNYA
jgi:hypothetical protein